MRRKEASCVVDEVRGDLDNLMEGMLALYEPGEILVDGEVSTEAVWQMEPRAVRESLAVAVRDLAVLLVDMRGLDYTVQTTPLAPAGRVGF